ncbi:hypothetical protein SAMN04488130_11513 [Flavobacterium urumqiense]|uniref:Uncharacterized protein n=1 Tax=Flavobacterium urumqiense TaxID=935224 RepID=A0A1H6AE26_9FLAO|nr:hypothetical protein SAMN04488130_11513 [Flavobacterium urumqiense]
MDVLQKWLKKYLFNQKSLKLKKNKLLPKKNALSGLLREWHD